MMGELVNLEEYRDKKIQAEIKELRERIELIRSQLGIITSGPLWLDPITGTIEQIIPGIEIS
jgi:hypothetical protein